MEDEFSEKNDKNFIKKIKMPYIEKSAFEKILIAFEISGGSNLFKKRNKKDPTISKIKQKIQRLTEYRNKLFHEGAIYNYEKFEDIGISDNVEAIKLTRELSELLILLTIKLPGTYNSLALKEFLYGYEIRPFKEKCELTPIFIAEDKAGSP